MLGRKGSAASNHQAMPITITSHETSSLGQGRQRLPRTNKRMRVKAIVGTLCGLIRCFTVLAVSTLASPPSGNNGEKEGWGGRLRNITSLPSFHLPLSFRPTTFFDSGEGEMETIPFHLYLGRVVVVHVVPPRCTFLERMNTAPPPPLPLSLPRPFYYAHS